MKSDALLGTARRLDRSWNEGQAQWWVVVALLAAVITAGAIGASSWHASAARGSEFDALLQEARRANDAAVAALPRGSAQSEDFVSTLPGAVSTSALVQQLQQESASAGVALVSVQVNARRDSAEQLGQTELAVQLRGPYVACKQVIKQMLERHTNLTLGHLRMRKAPTASEIEMHLSISAWTRPAQAATSAASAGRH